MRCSQCQELSIAYVEGLLSPRQQQEIRLHLQDCPVCRAEVDEHERLRDRLICDAGALPKASLKAAVTEQIAREQTFKPRRFAMSRRYGKVGLGIAAAAAIAVLAVAPWGNGRQGQALAAQVLTQAAKALSNLQSVSIKLNVRTIAHDNFESIALEQPFALHEMWKQFADSPKQRVEKPGRVATTDGESSLLLITTPDGGHIAAKGGPNTNFVGWMSRLLDVDQVLDRERRCAEQYGWDLHCTEQAGPDGRPQWVVTIEAKALGDFTNDWLKNKTISSSDQRRVYRFDAQTKRLEDLEVWVHGEEKDILVLDIVEIVYDPAIDPELFAVDVPGDAIWSLEPEVLPDNEKYAQMSPKEVAQVFFQALADEDWDQVLKVYPHSEVDQSTRDTYGGLRIIEIGEPFQSGKYSGWFVPYKIEINTGWFGIRRIKQHNLALRNENDAGRYVVDGGF